MLINRDIEEKLVLEELNGHLLLDLREQIVSLQEKVIQQSNIKDYSPQDIKDILEVASQDFQFKEGVVNFIAKVEGRMVGISSASVRKGIIIATYVLPEYQSQGIGKKLLTKLEHHLSTCGTNYIWLVSSITAKGFYESQGYSVLLKSCKAKGNVEVTLMRKILNEEISWTDIIKDNLLIAVNIGFRLAFQLIPKF